MKYLKYFENINTDQNKNIEVGQTWKSLEDSNIYTITNIRDNIVYIHAFDKAKSNKLSFNLDKFIDLFELVENAYDGINLDFNKLLYQEDGSIIGCYFITKEDEKTIEIMNILEYPSDKTVFMDSAKPFKIDIKNTKLPKSQITILKEDEYRNGFFYIKIPYWLYKKDLDNLKIKRISTELKRLSLKVNDIFKLNDKLVDNNLESYFKNAYFDDKTSKKLIPYYRDYYINKSKQRKEYKDSFFKNKDTNLS
jgi:hypothetical protein